MSDKLIMVVPNAHGRHFKVEKINKDDFHTLLNNSAEAKLRDDCETDESYKQIIPYIVVTGGTKPDEGTRILGAVRLSNSGEQRLHGLITLGFGGHVQWDDESVSPVDAFWNSVHRELKEELGLESTDYSEPQIEGLIHDDTTEVGSVHLGVLMFINLNSEKFANIQSGEPDKLKPFWTNMAYMSSIEPTRMEVWAHLTYNFMNILVQEAMYRQEQEQYAAMMQQSTSNLITS